MFRSKLISICSALLLSFSAFAGGESSGGGQAIKINGEIRFLDTVSDSDLALAEEVQDIEAKISSDSASFDRDHFSFQSLIFMEGELTELQQQVLRTPDATDIDTVKLSTAIGFEKAFSVSDRFFTNAEAVSNGILPSKRLPANKQLVIGWFDGEKLHLQPYLFRSLSTRDKTAFMLHEALRYYNVLHTDSNLSTVKIEKLVPQIMNQLERFK